MAPYKDVSNSVDNPGVSYSLQRDIFQRFSDDENSIFSRSNAAKNRPVNQNYTLRQSSKTSEPESASQNQCQAAPVNNSNVPPAPCSLPSAPPPAPPAPPPPPPPPTLNGGILPSIRLKSEISDRNEPPAKLQNAMMKDKKPFTYTPGGIDLSEIKSPRMQRRIVRNAQTPEDIILPPTSATPVNANLLPPSALAAMTPQIAIPVFPQNNKPLKKYNSPNQPPPSEHEQSTSQKQNIPPPLQKSSNALPAQKQNVPPPPPPHKNSNFHPSSITQQNPAMQRVEKQPTVSTNNKTNINAGSNENKPNTNSTQQQSTGGQDNSSRSRVGTLYIPPVSNAESNASKQNSSPPAFPVLREAPTPWLQKHQQQSESVPAWVNKNNNESENETKEKIYERKARVPPVHIHKDTHSENMSNGGTRVIPIQIEGSSQGVNKQNQRSTSQRWGNTTAGDNNQPVQSHENSRSVSNVTNKAHSEPDSKPIQSRSFKVIQKITGSDDDATDFNPNIPYNTEGVPLSQLRKLHLNDDDQAFMNRVKAQASPSEISPNRKPAVSVIEIRNDDEVVDDDTFLHMETDPRYRGSVIPSRAFRMLQSMTDSSQVTNNTSINNPSTTHSTVHNGNHAPNHTQGHNNFPAGANRTSSNVRTQERPNVIVNETENNTPVNKKTYIPPSERQAEQELRKYMGSSIPSRSFKMLQAMTATQDTSESICEKTDSIDEENKIPSNILTYPNPWPYPPHTAHDIYLLWQDYKYLYNLVSRPPSPFLDLMISSSAVDSIYPKSPLSEVGPSPVEIIITDDDDDVDRRSNKNSNSVPNFHSNIELSKTGADDNADHSVYAETTTPDKLIITEVMKSNSDNDVSLTVCLPLRKKSRTSVDFHEEITLSKIPTSNTNDDKQDISNQQPQSTKDDLQHDQSPQQSSVECETEHDDNKEEVATSDHSNAISTSSSSTDSNSIDFWKEIVDNEEDLLLYGNKRTKNEQKHADEPIYKKTAEHPQTNTNALPTWRIGNDVRNFVNYTSMSDDSSGGSESDSSKHSDCNNDSGSDDTSNDNKSESSVENDDYYNVYDFSTNTQSKYMLDNRTIPEIRKATCENDKPEPPTDNNVGKEVPVATSDCHSLQPPEVRRTLDTSDLEEDSGMNSDVGKYVSETDVELEPETGSELRKLSKYERAATHSRLYRLLLKEEKQQENNNSEMTEVQTDISIRKESLTLPLASHVESTSSSSGINSPMSPVVHEKLVGELVESLLKWKKGAAFRKLPPEKLREAAIKSLQTDTAGTSRSTTPYGTDKLCAEESTASAVNSVHRRSIWHDDSLYYPGFDICPSRAFKHLQSGRSTPTTWPKCPLVSNQTEPRNSLPKLTKSQDGSYKR